MKRKVIPVVSKNHALKNVGGCFRDDCPLNEGCTLLPTEAYEYDNNLPLHIMFISSDNKDTEHLLRHRIMPHVENSVGPFNHGYSSLVRDAVPNSYRLKKKEIECCNFFLRRDVSVLKPLGLVALGQVTYNMLKRTTDEGLMAEVHGRVVDSIFNLPIIPTYLPALTNSYEVNRMIETDIVDFYHYLNKKGL